MKNQKTAIIYSRVSTQDQDNQRQISELKEYAKFKNLKLLAVFEEKISGAVRGFNRVEFKKLLEFVDTNKPDNILVWELSRIGRSNRDIVNNIEDFIEKGVNIYMKKEGLNTLSETGQKDPTTGMLISVLGGLAEMERQTIKARSISGIRHNVSNGGAGTGVIKAYGYQSVNKMLVIDEEEAKVVKVIFEKYLTGMGCKQIASYLNSKEIKTKYNNLFEANKELKSKYGYKKKASDFVWKDGGNSA
ncbi:MAG: hypothetical protein DI538_05880 [Azospira oryzae]|nr:MAG: hypothetical protein DI538_05880 [Azospira oryzae]